MARHRYFRKYTEEELNEIKKNVCIKHNCPYLSGLSNYKVTNNISNRICMYCAYTGKRRGCMPDDCKHYLDEKPKKTHLF